MIVERLAKEWCRCGITQGDIVLIHSDCMRTMILYRRMGFNISPQTILESFLYSVGYSGTLIFPLFNFDFTNGVPFDISKTPSKMGVLSEAARSYPGAVRTGHPIYSFAIIGKKGPLFEGIDNCSGYGVDSPFGLLRKLHGKMAVLDLPDQDSLTFYHHIEEMHNVPYRHHKVFKGDYTDSTGVTTTRSYSIFVRNLNMGVETHTNPTGDLLWENGLYMGDLPNHGAGLRVISSNKMFDFVSKIIRAGLARGLLYKIARTRT
jgi:aminoglycoside 3-N-acetyltransferase